MYLSYFLATVLLAITPGPDTLFIAGQSLQFGWRVGIVITLGICLGLIGHIILVMLGVSALLATSKMGLIVLQTLGACYLVYLSWQNFVAVYQKKSISLFSINNSSKQLDYQKYFFRGAFINITNVKVLFFFVALLPQFIDLSRKDINQQMVILGMITVLGTAMVFVSIALCIGWLGDRLSNKDRFNNILNITSGTVMLGIAFYLFVAVLWLKV